MTAPRANVPSMSRQVSSVEAFLALEPETTSETTTSPYETRDRAPSRASSLAKVARRLSREFEESRPSEGFVAATSEVASTVVTGSSRTHTQTIAMHTDKTDGGVATKQIDGVNAAEPNRQSDAGSRPVASSETTTIAVPAERTYDATEPFENGYHFPPKYPALEATRRGLAAFWKFFMTPMGFFWTIYGLNVVAWGGMLFLLLCNAAPAMCYPSCDDIDSPRRKWIEWDSQILTALFCVTAFGLAPWRFRDLWFELKYRIKGDHDALRRLAGIHASWFRLKGSQDLQVDIGPDNIPENLPRECIPLPEKSMPAAPLTGTRAPATPVWKLDFVIQSMVWNTFAQCGLCGIMWGMNRYDRPSWSTGFLVGIGMVIAMLGGLVTFLEGKKVKSIEGVPLTDQDRERLARDKELGIPHYNNIKDKKPREKKQDPEK